VLHLFAHTGATTLALAAAGARVTHVDASRPAVAWARRNAELSALTDAPIRWIVDDALGYVRREARRGRRYAAIVLDPPSFGHGPGGSRWELGDALPDLLDACAAIAVDDVAVLLTTHTTGLEPEDLAVALADAFDPGPGSELVAERLHSRATSGAVLPLGAAARMIRA
jgi:23S rRNA (cytosine1962-C5)-methyltransferase